MKEQQKIIYIIIAIIIVIGAIICGTKGFNIELLYSNRQEIVISNNTELDKPKVEEIAKSVLGDKKIYLQNVERFGNAIQIISSEITDEEKNNIVNKLNEELSLNLSNDEVEVIKIANTRIRDILKPYIIPSVISFVIILVYFAIIYNKIGLKNILLKTILIPIITELTFYSIVAITRFPFGKVTTCIAIGLYVISIGYLTLCFQKEKLTIKGKKEND